MLSEGLVPALYIPNLCYSYRKFSQDSKYVIAEQMALIFEKLLQIYGHRVRVFHSWNPLSPRNLG
jgi:hypothetical protein